MDTAVDTGAAAPVNETVLPAADTGTVETPQAPTPVTIVETPKVTIDDTLKQVWAKNHPPRDNGKFAPRDPAAAEGAKPAEVAAAPDTKSADTPAETPVEPAKPAIDVPVSWSAEMKAKWAALSPDVQTYVAQRDKEAQNAISRAGNERKGLEERVSAYQPIDQLINTHKDDFARRNVTPAQAFQTLLNAQRMLDENPLAGLVQIASTYGIDLRQTAQQLIQQGQVIPPNPEVIQLKQEVARLAGHLTEQQRQQQAAEQAANQQVEASLRSQIEDFAKDKPYFERVKAPMSALLTSGEADTLETAYEQATWAVKDVRERIQADQRKADDDKRRDEQAKLAAAAKKSATVNVKSATVNGSTPKTMHDTLSEIARKAYGP